MPAEVLGQVCTRQLPARHTANGSAPLPNHSGLGPTNRAEETGKERCGFSGEQALAHPSIPFPISATQPSRPHLTSALRTGSVLPPRGGCEPML